MHFVLVFQKRIFCSLFFFFNIISNNFKIEFLFKLFCYSYIISKFSIKKGNKSGFNEKIYKRSNIVFKKCNKAFVRVTNKCKTCFFRSKGLISADRIAGRDNRQPRKSNYSKTYPFSVRHFVC